MKDILTILKQLPFHVDGIFYNTPNGLVKIDDNDKKIDFTCYPMAYIVQDGDEKIKPLGISLCADEHQYENKYYIVFINNGTLKERTVIDKISDLLVQNDCTDITLDKSSKAIKDQEKITGDKKFIKIKFTYAYYTDDCTDIECDC